MEVGYILLCGVGAVQPDTDMQMHTITNTHKHWHTHTFAHAHTHIHIHALTHSLTYTHIKSPRE